MDIREEQDRPCAHHVGIAERRPCRVESGKEREIREARVHPIDRTDDVPATRGSCNLHHPSVIHLINANRSPRSSDHPGYLAMGEEITTPAGTNPEFPHAYARMMI